MAPRAGFPLRPASSRWAIASLCRAGHDVAVVLQEAVGHPQAAGNVGRYLAQICTPHSPFLQHGAYAVDGEPPTEEPPAWGAPHRDACLLLREPFSAMHCSTCTSHQRRVHA